MCFDESATQSNNMPKLTFTIPMNRRLTRLRTEPRDALGLALGISPASPAFGQSNYTSRLAVTEDSN